MMFSGGEYSTVLFSGEIGDEIQGTVVNCPPTRIINRGRLQLIKRTRASVRELDAQDCNT